MTFEIKSKGIANEISNFKINISHKKKTFLEVHIYFLFHFKSRQLISADISKELKIKFRKPIINIIICHYVSYICY